MADGKTYPPQSKCIEAGPGLVVNANVGGYRALLRETDSRVDGDSIDSGRASAFHTPVKVVKHSRNGIFVDTSCVHVPCVLPFDVTQNDGCLMVCHYLKYFIV